MRYKEFIEGIRMGARDLATPSNKQYTVGFEFEVSVDDDAPGNSGYDDDEMSDLYDEFSENWYANNSFDFEDWFRDEYLRNIRILLQFINGEAIESRYGFVPAELAAKASDEENRARILIRAGELYDPLMKTLADFKSDPDSFVTDTKKAVDLVQLYEFLVEDYYSRSRNTNRTEDEIKNKIDSVIARDGIDKLKQNLNFYYTELTYRFKFTKADPKDFENSAVYGDEQRTEIISLVDIDDVEQFTDYFNVDIDELRDITENQWQDLESEQMSQDFNDWMNNRTRQAKSDKLAYVVSVIEDEFNTTVRTTGSSATNWAVIPDGTPGVHAEITTPAFAIKPGIAAMHRVLNLIASDPHMYTGQPTGLHVNVGTFDKNDIDKVDWLKFLMIMNAERVLAQFDRTYNTYAPDKLPQIIKKLQDNDIVAYQSQIKKINSIVRTSSDKYSAINLSKLNNYGIIELRAPGNAGYEKAGAFLEQTILRIVRALELASDPAKYKNEYISMLYKRYGKETSPTDNRALNTYFEVTFGTPFYAWGSLFHPIEKAIQKRKTDKPDAGFTIAVHKELVQAITTASKNGTLDIDIANIKTLLSQYDTDGVMANSKLIKAIVNTLTKLG
jgi:hypothetical protein